MDRCALFVDAGYALADGAMAVHGTRRRDSVSWDHAGLLKLLAGLARDRTGLPVLRCYWYETAAEGRRTAEHDALAEMPGLKLRLVNALPGRREGIEGQLRRDLVTLAKSGAISDAFIASANEHIAEIVAEVQDLGLRVVVLHIASDSGWTIPLPLRQECDDIVEISGVHLRPFVDLIRGAEPAADDQFSAGQYGGRGLVDAKNAVVGALTHQGLPAAALPAPGVVYQVPDSTEYRQDLASYSAQSLAQQSHESAPSQHGGASGTSQGQQSPEVVTGYHDAAPSQAPGNGVGQAGQSQVTASDYQGGGQGGYQAGGAGGYQNGSLANGSVHGADTQSENAQGGYHNTPGQGPSAVQNGLAQNGLAQYGYQPGHQGSHQGAGPGDATAYQNGQNGQNGHAPQGIMQNGQGGQSSQNSQGGQNGLSGQNGNGHQSPSQGMPGQNGSGQGSGLPGQIPAGANGAIPGHSGLSLAHPGLGAGSPGLNGSMSEFNGSGQPSASQSLAGQAMPGANAPGASNGHIGGPNGVGPGGQAGAARPGQGGVPQLGSQQLGSQQFGSQQLGAQSFGAPVHTGYQPGQSGNSQGAGRGGQAPGGFQPGSSPSGLAQVGSPSPQQGSQQTGSPQSGPQHANSPYANPPHHNSPQGGQPQVGSPQPDPRAGDPYGQVMQSSMAAGFEPAPTPLPVQQGFGPPEAGFGPGHHLPPNLPQGQGQGQGQGPVQSAALGGLDQSQRPSFSQAPGMPMQPQYQLPHQSAPAQHPGAAVAQVPAQLQPRPQPVAIALPDAVKAAHAEGFNFGESVGRDAPGLWLEAVLARKPRMPSDLEARLLQGSVLPIDSLLHDEVRHSLRRGFWDALESARR